MRAVVARLRQELKALFEVQGIEWQRLLKGFGVVAAVFLGLVVFVSPWKVLAFFLGIGILAAVWYRPTWMLAFLAAYIPFEPFLLKFVPDELFFYAKYFSESLIYLLLGSALLRRWLDDRKPWRTTPIDLPFALFLLVAVASAVSNLIEPGVAILGIRQMIRFILLFFAVTTLSPSRDFARKLTVLMLVVVLFQALLGIAQAATGGALDTFLIPSERRSDGIQFAGSEQFWAPGQRVFGTLGRYDQLGTFLCFFMLLLVGWIYEIKKGSWHQWFFFLFTLSSVTLALTYSRASWFGFLLGFLYLAVRVKKDRKVLAGFLAVAGILAAYTIYSGVVVRYLVDLPEQSLYARLLEAFSYERYRGEYYGLGRVYWFVQTPLVVVPAAPIFGHGPAMYGGGAAAVLGNTQVYDGLGLPYGVYGTEGYIDNNWFSLWGEVGTLGLALYVWMFVTIFGVARKVYKGTHDPFWRGLGLGFMGAMLAFALQAFLATYLEVRTIGLYFWLFAALLVVAAKREKLT